MKLAIVGLGQCGGRIADEFTRMQMRSHGMRGIDIIMETIAVNTDAADLAGIISVRPDANHRLLIGAGATHGHGTARVGELGADIMRGEGGKVLEALKRNQKLSEAEALLVIAATAGGTGSGGAPVLVHTLKEHITDKPVYAILVLPFEHEENSDESAVFNTAMCLKSTNAVADAVILVDNQRFVRKDSSIRANILKINQAIVEPFFNLLCAGEEKRPKNIGAKVMDAGDIIATLDGWTAMGYGKSVLPLITLPKDSSHDFVRKDIRTNQGMHAMNEALAELSFNCKPSEAHKALYLVSAPVKEMSMDLTEGLGDYMRKTAPDAEIRSGDYPREKGLMDVTVILSNFGENDRIKHFYEKTTSLLKERPARQQAKADRATLTEEAGKDIPSLL
jgi:cell division GTPase FtsZ